VPATPHVDPPSDSVTRLGTPIADTGPLPPELLAAFNGAVKLATYTCGAAQLIACGGARAFDVVRGFLDGLVREHNPARDAILKVANDLASTRQHRGPARFGKIVRATAHEAALALSVDIDQRIRSAVIAAHDAIEQAEPGTWILFVGAHEAAPDLDWLQRHFHSWRGHFDGAGLPAPDEVIAELGLEARGAFIGWCDARPGADRRQQVCLDGDRVLLHAKPVALDMTPEAREKAITFLRYLLDARGSYVSGGDIDRAEADKDGGLTGTRWDKVKKSLPSQLQNFIESDRRKGYRLLPSGRK
jgi:hypothetical protein